MADEPTTGLDVTVQAQILDLLSQLQRDRDMAMVLVTHDLGVVATRTDEIIVMYAGNVVERAPTNVLFKSMAMPYTEALLNSTPRIANPSHTRLTAIEGRPPDLLHPPAGCPFSPRCPYAQDKCHREKPPLGRGGAGAQLRLLVSRSPRRPRRRPRTTRYRVTETVVVGDPTRSSRVEDLHVSFHKGNTTVQAVAGHHASPCARARRSASSASPGAASRPPAAPSSRSSGPRRAGSASATPSSTRAQPRRPAHAAHPGADDLPGPDLLA